MALELPILIGQAAMPALSLGFELDLHVFAFAFGLSLLTGLLVGGLAGIQAWKPDLAWLNSDRLAGGRGPGITGRQALIGLQMALSLLLLIPCGLLVRSWLNASAIDPGFSAGGVVLLPIASDQQGARVQKPKDFEHLLAERVRALPGVEAATVMDPVPLWYGGSFSLFAPEEGAGSGPRQRMGFSRIGVDYFRALKIPLLRGRDFTTADTTAGSLPVAIVNETLARRFWPDGDALGKRIRSATALIEVVGVATDAKT